MATLESIDNRINSVESVIPDETLDDLILNAIMSIRNSKRPYSNSIFLKRELKNSNITYTQVETRLPLLTVDGKLVIKYPSGKASYWIRAESEQELSSFKTVGNSSSTVTPVASGLICETLIISLKESSVNNNLSLE